MPLHWFVRRWVQQQAAEHVAEAVENYRRQQAEPQQFTTEGERELPEVHVGVVCGRPAEAGYLLDKLSDASTYQGQACKVQVGLLGETLVAVAVFGSGPAKAAEATTALLIGHHPAYVIAAGFASGLSEDVRTADLLVASSVVDPTHKKLAIDAGFSGGLPRGVHLGNLLTVDELPRSPADKQALGQEYSALAADTESFAVAGVCSAAKARFLAVRSILDPLAEERSADVERLLKHTSKAGKLGAALGTFVRRPGTIKDLYHHQEIGIQAATRLADFLADLIPQLHDDQK